MLAEEREKKREREKTIVEYLIKRIERLFVHRQTRRWIGHISPCLKVGYDFANWASVLRVAYRDLVTKLRFIACSSWHERRLTSWSANHEFRLVENARAGFHGGMESARKRSFKLAFVSTINSKINNFQTFLSNNLFFYVFPRYCLFWDSIEIWIDSGIRFSGEEMGNKKRKVPNSFFEEEKMGKRQRYPLSISMVLKLPPVHLYDCCNTQWRSAFAITAILDPYSFYSWLFSLLRYTCILFNFALLERCAITLLHVILRAIIIEGIRILEFLKNYTLDIIFESWKRISLYLISRYPYLYPSKFFSLFFGKIWDPLLLDGLLSHSGFVFLFFFFLIWISSNFRA